MIPDHKSPSRSQMYEKIQTTPSKKCHGQNLPHPTIVITDTATSCATDETNDSDVASNILHSLVYTSEELHENKGQRYFKHVYKRGKECNIS